MIWKNLNLPYAFYLRLSCISSQEHGKLFRKLNVFHFLQNQFFATLLKNQSERLFFVANFTFLRA